MRNRRELCGKVGDGVSQAADFISAASSIPPVDLLHLVPAHPAAAGFRWQDCSGVRGTSRKDWDPDAVKRADQRCGAGRIRTDLLALGFAIEQSKTSAGKILRPVYFGESGVPSLAYEIDGFHAEWRCGIEIEAGRGWMGNAVYRDLVQALIMVNVEHLVLAVANTYKYLSSGKAAVSKDYDNTLSVAEALYGHSRIRMPYGLTVIGY